MKRKNRELELKVKLAKFEDVDEYTEEDLQALKETDPDTYIDILLKKKEKENLDKEFTQVVQEDKVKSQVQEVIEFTKELNVSPDNVKEFLSSPEFQQVDQYLTQYIKPEGPNGEYTASQIQIVYHGLFHDKLKEDLTRKKIKLQEQEEAASNGKELLSNHVGDTGSMNVNLDRLTQEEIDKLPPDKLEEYLEKFEER